MGGRVVRATSSVLVGLATVFLLVLGLALGSANAAWAEVQAATTDGLSAADAGTALTEPTKSVNAWDNDYEVNARCVKSYLSLITVWEDVDGDGTEEKLERLQRVEYVEGTGLVVEWYDPTTFRFKGGKVIDPETYRFENMPVDEEIIWGGYHHAGDINYVVTGRVNEDESDDYPVVLVAMYNSDWELMGTPEKPYVLEIAGINIYKPFADGSCRIIDHSGNLWIHTCHEMYGSHRQANMMLVVEDDKPELTDYFTSDGPPDSPESTRFDYVSRTFNQFITSIGDSLYTADHCDAFPQRGFVLSGLDWRDTYTCPLSFAGGAGDDATYAGLGGLEASGSETKNVLILAGNSVDQAGGDPAGSPRNVWISLTDTVCFDPQDQGDSGDSQGSQGGSQDSQDPDGQQDSEDFPTEFFWVTYYSSETASVPFLAKVGDDKFMIAWGVKPLGAGSSFGAQVHYRFFDGNGDPLGDEYVMPGAISDCQPIVADGKVIWYATGTPADASAVQTTYSASKPTIYAVDAETMEPVEINLLETATVYTDEADYPFTGYQVKPQVTVKVDGETLVEGTDYTVTYGENVNAGLGSLTINGIGEYEGGVKRTSFRIAEAYIGDATIRYNSLQRYTGKPVQPKVTAEYNGKALVQGRDFSVEYANNIARGIGVIRLHGLGNFRVNKDYDCAFVITDAVDLPTPQKVKTALAGAKSIKVTWAKVVGATKYAVYRNGVLAATVDTNAWTDKSRKTNGGKYAYQVVALSSLDASDASAAAMRYFFTRVKVKSAKSTVSRQVTVKWSKNSLASGYKLRYKLGKKSKTVTAKNSTTLKKVLKKLKPNKTYRIQVRVYRKVGTKTYYSAWSPTKKVKVLK